MSAQRAGLLRRLAAETFDVLVIGGGITGAGIAQDAATRGLRVALVEKGDFASGTTHASTKLLHGGLRYLEQFQFRLMYEALHERNRLTRLAPELAEWLPFLIPIYRGGWSAWRIRIGLWLYDLLAGLPRGRLHRRISRAEALRLAPHLRAEGLRGAFLYYDCRTDDTALTLAVLQSAWEAGAAAVNYCAATELVKEEGRIAGAIVHDRVSGERIAVRAALVINAAGPWADDVVRLERPDTPPQLQPSKGAHVLVPAARLPVAAALLAPSAEGDGRFIFVVPWHGAVLLGTTDTAYDGDPDAVAADDDDIDYILAAANRLFPAVRLTRADVLSTIAGLRPLLRTAAETTAAAPREYRIWESPSGLISIAGGKLTTYRTMAAAATDAVLQRLGRERAPCRTGEMPLGDSRRQALSRLVAKFPELSEPLGPGLAPTLADVAYAAWREQALTPDDVLHRRTRLALVAPDCGEAQRERIAELIRAFGAWDGEGPLPDGVSSNDEEAGREQLRSRP